MMVLPEIASGRSNLFFFELIRHADTIFKMASIQELLTTHYPMTKNMTF